MGEGTRRKRSSCRVASKRTGEEHDPQHHTGKRRTREHCSLQNRGRKRKEQSVECSDEDAPTIEGAHLVLAPETLGQIAERGRHSELARIENAVRVKRLLHGVQDRGCTRALRRAHESGSTEANSVMVTE